MAAPASKPALPLRAAVVGTGGISKEHLSFLAGRTVVGPVEDRALLLAVCDLSPAAARYAASTYGAAGDYTDVDEMLKSVRPDVVHVLTPPATHVDLATRCLEAGAHVICEKPVAPSSDELCALISAADRADRRIMECHNYLCNPTIRAIRSAIDDGELGPVREVEIRMSLPITDPAGRYGDPNLPSPLHAMPAGVIHDFITHFAYLLLKLAPGVHYDRIASAWSRHGDNELFCFDDLDAVLIGSGPDGPVHGRLRFDARSSPDAFTVVVRGRDGYAETDLFQPYVRIVRPRPGGEKLSPIVNHVVNGAGLMRAGARNFGRKLLQHTPYEGLHRMLDLTYTQLASDSELPVTVDDMRASTALIEALLDEGARL